MVNFKGSFKQKQSAFFETLDSEASGQQTTAQALYPLLRVNRKINKLRETPLIVTDLSTTVAVMNERNYTTRREKKGEQLWV